jgi:hypothetical protein
MANLGLHEMLGQLRHCGENGAVRDGGNFSDQAMMVVDEPEV